jgi:ABC-type sugar transport system ATPase subunit
MIVPDLSVAENVLLGSEPGLGGVFYSRRKTERRAAAIFDRLGVGTVIDPARMSGQLTTAQKQIVEIARALVLQVPVIIMDEPTAALSEREARGLLRIIRQLRSEGVAILFVSHRLEEVRRIADRITVLRGGRRVETLRNSSRLVIATSATLYCRFAACDAKVPSRLSISMYERVRFWGSPGWSGPDAQR